MESSIDSDNEVARLKRKLESEYELTCERLKFGKYDLDLYRPADPNVIMDDEMLEKTYAEMQWQPYWAQAWEASNGLCEFLASKDLSDLRVLDLGCGLGITTALLLAAGANVIAGDNAPPALEFTRLNTWPWRDRCEICTVDWNKSVIETPFDLIIGSDILYDRADIVPLDQFFRQHLNRGGYVILADPSRAMTREFLDKFAELGWNQTTTMIELKQTKFPSRIVEMRP